MELSRFPLDTQICKMQISSCKYSRFYWNIFLFRAFKIKPNYPNIVNWTSKPNHFLVSKTTKELILFWDNDKSHDDTVSVARDLRLPQFEMQKITTNRCSETNHMGTRNHIWIATKPKINAINILSQVTIKLLSML